MIVARRAVVVAYDGLVVETLDLRSSAVVEGLAAVGFSVDVATVRANIAGSSIAEAVRIACDVSEIDSDETMLDIAGIRASRALATAMRQPILLAPSASEWLLRASLGARVVVRADSARVHVEPVLAASGLSDAISLVVCADDVATAGGEVPMFVRAWDMIAERCRAVGVLFENLHGLECAYAALCTRVNVGRIRRVTSITEVEPDALQLS